MALAELCGCRGQQRIEVEWGAIGGCESPLGHLQDRDEVPELAYQGTLWVRTHFVGSLAKKLAGQGVKAGRARGLQWALRCTAESWEAGTTAGMPGAPHVWMEMRWQSFPGWQLWCPA